jgi:uncharacterized protein (DUF1330 family)
MSKGYLMANLKGDGPKIFKKFSAIALPLIEKYGGKLSARGPQADRHKGTMSGVATLIEFKSKSAADEYDFNNGYQAVKAIKDQGVDTHLMNIKGV